MRKKSVGKSNLVKVRLVDDRREWERFLGRIERRSFPQSWNWGDFQKKLGNTIWRVGVFQGENMVGSAQLIGQRAKRGRFIVLPHGPSFLPQKEEFLPELIEYIRELAKKNGSWFFRLAPFWLDNKENRKRFSGLGFRRAPMYIHAEQTWNLDLGFPEEELLAAMRKTTRWSIRKAVKEGVRVEISANSEDIKIYHRLEEITVQRKHFTPYSFKFETKLFDTFVADDQIKVFKGVWKEEVLSMAVVIFWQKRAFYYLGASSLKHPKTPVSHLVQWEVIREAKRRGCVFYNFWGIAPTDDKNHPWWGITLFKKGFGGFEEKLMSTMDMIIDPRYLWTWGVETVRKKKRGL